MNVLYAAGCIAYFLVGVMITRQVFFILARRIRKYDRAYRNSPVTSKMWKTPAPFFIGLFLPILWPLLLPGWLSYKALLSKQAYSFWVWFTTEPGHRKRMASR